MKFNLSDLEREYLIELLDNTYIETMREENHTDARAYREALKDRIRLIDGLRDRLKNLITTNDSDESELKVRAASNQGIF